MSAVLLFGLKTITLNCQFFIEPCLSTQRAKQCWAESPCFLLSQIVWVVDRTINELDDAGYFLLALHFIQRTTSATRAIQHCAASRCPWRWCVSQAHWVGTRQQAFVYNRHTCRQSTSIRPQYGAASVSLYIRCDPPTEHTCYPYPVKQGVHTCMLGCAASRECAGSIPELNGTQGKSSTT